MAWLGGAGPQDDQGALIGGSMEKSVGYLIERGASYARPDQVADWLRSGMAAVLASREVEPMPGAVQLISQVRAAGVPYALRTSAAPTLVDALLSALAKRDLGLDVIVCGADAPMPNPHPQPSRRAAH